VIDQNNEPQKILLKLNKVTIKIPEPLDHLKKRAKASPYRMNQPDPHAMEWYQEWQKEKHLGKRSNSTMPLRGNGQLKNSRS